MKPLPIILVALLCSPVFASSESNGPKGVNATGLTLPNGEALTGGTSTLTSNIVMNVGQVEVFRVAKPGFDGTAEANAGVVPFETRNSGGGFPSAGTNISEHPVEVASVMIGKGPAPAGMTPDAQLYSVGFSGGGGGLVTDVLLSTQYLAKFIPASFPEHIHAINHSWGIDSTNPSQSPSGDDQVTLGLDWIAFKHDVLNVVSGVQEGRQNRAPADNYNGITVGRLIKDGNGVYRKVSPNNDFGVDDDAFGVRTSIDILAPGDGVDVATIGATNPTTTVDGSSYAAPHVTGAATLLVEYAVYQIQNTTDPRWNPDNSRKHEVIKAVLLNSADKLDGVHGSTRDVLDTNGLKWTDSQAFGNPERPLDEQLGAGALNVGNALRQFQSGEYNAGESVPNIGWDYDETGGQFTTRDYYLNVTQGGYVAITLAWDRLINKNGPGNDATYTSSDMFSGTAMTSRDLDLFLIPDDPNVPILSSEAGDESVEHIFAQITPGTYTLRVQQLSGGDLDYGLAWWAGEIPAPVNTPGDFDDDGDVDGTDLNLWKGDYGTHGVDADGDGLTGGADFLIWQRNFGTTLAIQTAKAVPEPCALGLCLCGALTLYRCNRGWPRLRSAATGAAQSAIGGRKGDRSISSTPSSTSSARAGRGNVRNAADACPLC